MPKEINLDVLGEIAEKLIHLSNEVDEGEEILKVLRKTSSMKISVKLLLKNPIDGSLQRLFKYNNVKVQAAAKRLEKKWLKSTREGALDRSVALCKEKLLERLATMNVEQPRKRTMPCETISCDYEPPAKKSCEKVEVSSNVVVEDDDDLVADDCQLDEDVRKRIEVICQMIEEKNQQKIEENDSSTLGYVRKHSKLGCFGIKSNNGKVNLLDKFKSLLLRNIDLTITGLEELSFDIIEPMLINLNVGQLEQLEKSNPQLMSKTDGLWKRFVLKKEPSRIQKEDEKWRSIYLMQQKLDNQKMVNSMALYKLRMEELKTTNRRTVALQEALPLKALKAKLRR